jgi:UDP-N-acetyl-D-mannosaminuronate dehydrogenase
VPTIEEAIEDADVVAFLTGHKEFKEFPLQKIARLAKPHAIIIDGRIFYSKDQIKRIRSLGMVYKGVGR